MCDYFNIELKKLIFDEDDLLFETMILLALAAKREVSECKYHDFKE